MNHKLVAIVSTALALLTAFGCGGDGATNPDPNQDRLEITFGYANAMSPLGGVMDLFQMTKDGRLTWRPM